MAKPKILLTIAGRGGSKGVKNKNIRELCGLPLIAHTIRQAKIWSGADKIICSTDSEAIADVARRHGAEVPFMRPPELATDSAGKQGVLRHALKTLNSQDGPYDIVIDLDVTSPIRTPKDIQGALDTFLRQKPDAVVSVTPCRRNPYFNMLEPGPAGFMRLVKNPGGAILRRQDAPAVYDMNASIYVYDSRFLLNENMPTVLAGRTLVWVMGEYSAFDIDHEEDFQFIEFLVSKGIVTL